MESAAHGLCHHITYSYPEPWLAISSRTHSAELIDEDALYVSDGHPDANKSQQAGNCRRTNTCQVSRGTLCERGTIIKNMSGAGEDCYICSLTFL